MILYESNSETGITTAIFGQIDENRHVQETDWKKAITETLLKRFKRSPFLDINANPKLWEKIYNYIDSVDKIAKTKCKAGDKFDTYKGETVAKAKLMRRWDNTIYGCIFIIKEYIHNEALTALHNANSAQSSMWKYMLKNTEIIKDSYLT